MVNPAEALVVEGTHVEKADELPLQFRDQETITLLQTLCQQSGIHLRIRHCDNARQRYRAERDRKSRIILPAIHLPDMIGLVGSIQQDASVQISVHCRTDLYHNCV